MIQLSSLVIFFPPIQRFLNISCSVCLCVYGKLTNISLQSAFDLIVSVMSPSILVKESIFVGNL